jgi:hypothetical protein
MCVQPVFSAKSFDLGNKRNKNEKEFSFYCCAAIGFPGKGIFHISATASHPGLPDFS